MTTHDVSDTSPARTSRRAVVGAAWAAPVIVTSATVPAFAVSPIACPAVPAASQWSATTVVSGQPDAKDEVNDWNTAIQVWAVYQDNRTGTTPLVYRTTSPVFAVTPGATYQASYDYYYQFANSNASTSSVGTFEMLFNGVVVQSLSRSGPNDTWQTRAFTYAVPSGTTTLQVTYRYTMAGRGNPGGRLSGSDDLAVLKVSFTSCSI